VLGPAQRPVLVVHPGSGSPTKNWEGFPALVAAWQEGGGGAAVAVYGPAETAGAVFPAGVQVVRERSLPEVAGLLARADAYAGNDSGISHLAGVVGARGVVLFGDTDVSQWAPRAAGLRVLRAAGACGLCGVGRLCVHRLPVARVLEGVREAVQQPTAAGCRR
jgi:ADP-heptose:LPS heptosyltransferase